jgi:hypothetical protein
MRPYANEGPTTFIALFSILMVLPCLVDVLFCLCLTPLLVYVARCCLFSLYVAYTAYVASLLPVCTAYAACAAYAAYRLALFSNGVFRVCVCIN